MRVLLITNEFPPMVGGVGRLCANLSYALARVGVQVHVVTTVASPEAKGPVKVVQCLGAGRSVLDRKLLKALPTAFAANREARRSAPCLSIAATCNHEGLVALILRTLGGPPYCVLVHGSELRINATNWIRKRLMQLVLRRAAFLVANSAYTRGLASQLVPEAHIEVSPPPVELPVNTSPDSHAATAPPCDLEGEPVLLTTARLVPRKRHEDVVRTIPGLLADYPRLVYYLTGDGPCRKGIEELAASIGVRSAVRLLGRVDDGTLERLYRRADIYVSPGSEDGDDVEGFGISLVEASSYGLPVVAGKGGGVGDAVKDGVSGILIAPGNLEDLAGALRRLLSDRDLARRMGEHGRAWVAEHFGLERAGARFAETAAKWLQPKSALASGCNQVCTQRIDS